MIPNTRSAPAIAPCTVPHRFAICAMGMEMLWE
jgi:hypothetical protein